MNVHLIALLIPCFSFKILEIESLFTMVKPYTYVSYMY